MRVLDLGSGKGATSVFLTREYGVDVAAADWWIGPVGDHRAGDRHVARLQPDGWHDRLPWARARASYQSVIDTLVRDGGGYLSFALVAARRHAR